MLKNIDPLLTGELLAILSDMGHGDEIVIVDANFPAAALARRLVRLPASTVTRTLAAVLSVLPLDDFVDAPATAMAAPGEQPTIHAEFDQLLQRAEGRIVGMTPVDRFEFYERARHAHAIIATGERRLYANIVLKKGVLHDLG